MARRPPSRPRPPRQKPRSRRPPAEPKPTETKGIRGLTHRLAQMALELAADRERTRERKLTADEVKALLDVGGDPSPDPSPDLLAEALAGLPDHRRAILIAVLHENASRRTVARRFDISVRTLDSELRQALLDALRYVEQIRDGGTRR